MAQKFYLDGQWWESEEHIAVRNPYTDALIDEVCCAERSLLETIEEVNQKAFSATRELPSWKRSQVLQNIASGIAARKEEFALGIVAESGKPLRFAKGEVERAVLTFTLAAEEARRLDGESIPLDLNRASEGRFGVTRRFPIGPVIGITPFNFPLNLVAHKIGPAIAAGNPITLKPSSQTPLTALRLAEVIAEAGVLPGQVNVVPMRAALAENLVQSPIFRILSFTGSDAVGWRLKGLNPKKHVTLELGGNAALVIDRDVDLENVIPRAIVGAFAYAGQVCISIQRIIVHQDLYDRFVAEFASQAETAEIGDPQNEKVLIGPMIDVAAADRVERWIAEARDAGAKIIAGGQQEGKLIRPTVIVDVVPAMKVYAAEAFAPLVTIEPFRSWPEAIEKANRSRFGLQAGVFSNHYEHILYAYRQLDVGAVIANDFPTYRVDNMPYGGVKDSGFGREGLKYAVREMTESRLLVLNSLGF